MYKISQIIFQFLMIYLLLLIIIINFIFLEVTVFVRQWECMSLNMPKLIVIILLKRVYTTAYLTPVKRF